MTVIIPARYGSTRFPAKILAAKTGRPLVQHVVDQALKCRRVGRVVVATDDARIESALRPFGTEIVMTSPAHQSGTDRIAEVARGLDDEIVVNVQGDEPEIEPEIIDGLIALLQDGDSSGGGVVGGGVAGGGVAGGGVADMATAATAFPAGADVGDSNLVKVVVGLHGQAIYFSRSPIPFRREPAAAEKTGQTTSAGYFLHLGIYAYRREFLLRYASWKPTPLEMTEKLEQLRVLEHGGTIQVLMVNRAAHGIDTAEQYEAFVSRFVSRQSAVGSRQ